jgi:hypothetical protein
MLVKKGGLHVLSMQLERNPLVSGHLGDLGENCRKILKVSERKQVKENAIYLLH